MRAGASRGSTTETDLTLSSESSAGVRRKNQDSETGHAREGCAELSQADGDPNPTSITTHAELPRNKPAHLPPTPMSIRLQRKKGHIPSTCVTRRFPALL